MPIYQINIWICEKCGKIETTTDETFLNDDPLVEPPNDAEWNYIYEEDPTKDEHWNFIHKKKILLCPECYEKEK